MKSFDYMAYCAGARTTGYLGIGLILGALVGSAAAPASIFGAVVVGFLLLALAARAKDVEERAVKLGTLSQAEFAEELERAPHDYARMELIALRERAHAAR